MSFRALRVDNDDPSLIERIFLKLKATHILTLWPMPTLACNRLQQRIATSDTGANGQFALRKF